MFNEVFENVLMVRADYPEIYAAVCSLMVMTIGYLGSRMFKSKPLSEEAKYLASLLECKQRWRWGMKGNKPTGKSIICDNGRGTKVIALFKNDKFSISDEPCDLSKAEAKYLSKLRNKVVNHLKDTDRATAVRVKENKRQQRVATLSRV